jgi:hypothetical protein
MLGFSVDDAPLWCVLPAAGWQPRVDLDTRHEHRLSAALVPDKELNAPKPVSWPSCLCRSPPSKRWTHIKFLYRPPTGGDVRSPVNMLWADAKYLTAQSQRCDLCSYVKDNLVLLQLSCTMRHFCGRLPLLGKQHVGIAVRWQNF